MGTNGGGSMVAAAARSYSESPTVASQDGLGSPDVTLSTMQSSSASIVASDTPACSSVVRYSDTDKTSETPTVHSPHSTAGVLSSTASSSVIGQFGSIFGLGIRELASYSSKSTASPDLGDQNDGRSRQSLIARLRASQLAHCQHPSIPFIHPFIVKPSGVSDVTTLKRTALAKLRDKVAAQKATLAQMRQVVDEVDDLVTAVHEQECFWKKIGHSKGLPLTKELEDGYRSTIALRSERLGERLCSNNTNDSSKPLGGSILGFGSQQLSQFTGMLGNNELSPPRYAASPTVMRSPDTPRAGKPIHLSLSTQPNAAIDIRSLRVLQILPPRLMKHLTCFSDACNVQTTASADHEPAGNGEMSGDGQQQEGLAARTGSTCSCCDGVRCRHKPEHHRQ